MTEFESGNLGPSESIGSDQTISDVAAAALKRTIKERDSTIAHLQNLIAERSTELAQRDEALAERGTKLLLLLDALARAESEMSSLRIALAEIKQSTSWIVTAPLRSAKRQLKSLKRGALGHLVGAVWKAVKNRSSAPLQDLRDAGAIARSGLFERAWYLGQNPDVAATGINPIRHYVAYGAREGRDPSSSFSTLGYLSRYSDVAEAKVNPLAHFIRFGAREGRVPIPLDPTQCCRHPPDLERQANKPPAPRAGGRTVSGMAKPTFDRSRLDPSRENVLLISHEASRTGAPVLAWNIAGKLRAKYNVIALLLRGGEIAGSFTENCAAVVGPLNIDDRDPNQVEHLVEQLLSAYPISYAIANSIESRLFVRPLIKAFVPVISLVHEFASYTRPKGAMSEALNWSTQIVFSSAVTLASATEENPRLANRKVCVIPQGRSEVPRDASSSLYESILLREALRSEGGTDALVVLGAGTVQIRKGVDLFLSCAAQVAAMKPKCPVRFVWIGDGYDLASDVNYSAYLAEQIARSGLNKQVTIMSALDDLEAAYAMADIFFLSSRLDPLPNVTIDAAFHGLPIVCFEGASGIATLLAADNSLRQSVVPHLDVHAAALVITELANDEDKRSRLGAETRRFAEVTFDMNRYADQLDSLGREAILIMRQRALDFATLRDSSLFDAAMFLPPGATKQTREDAIHLFLSRWAATGTARKPAADPHFRRPCAGFHPQIYAHEHAGQFDVWAVNPFAHYVRNGTPPGPWRHEILTPRAGPVPSASSFRTALHVHFYYPELAPDFLRKLSANRSPIDLLLSTDTGAKEASLRDLTRAYARGNVHIRRVPNIGRDIGAFLSGFNDLLPGYDILGHVHSKRSTWDPVLGERRREFLWQNLIGGRHGMADLILNRFVEDEELGIVFAEDPHLSDWDDNLEIAESLANRMDLQELLPPFFEFPNGNMFWARRAALEPLFGLKLDWQDYPEEPLRLDGTLLHAIERLLPIIARRTGYQFAAAHVPGVTW